MKDEIYFWLRGMAEGLEIAAELLTDNSIEPERLPSVLQKIAQRKREEMEKRDSQ